MAFNLKNKNLLTLKDYTPQKINFLIDLSSKLKSDKYAGIYGKNLENKNVALLFEKPSTRTRCAFVVACIDEGAHPEYLGKDDLQFGKKESVKDTAIVLGRMFDGIMFRGFKHSTVETLAKYSGVPVWNGLTDLFHPTQVLADFLTVKENFGCLKGISFTYCGDGRNNVANSLLIGAAKCGMDYRTVTPKELYPDKKLIDEASVSEVEELRNKKEEFEFFIDLPGKIAFEKSIGEINIFKKSKLLSLLVFFIRNSNKGFTSEEIYGEIRTGEYEGDISGTEVRKYISRIRNIIEPDRKKIKYILHNEGFFGEKGKYSFNNKTNFCYIEQLD